MSHARRYHEPGVGSRTGMRVEDGVLELDDFLRAGRKALIGSLPRRSDASVSSSIYNAKSARASSSMIIEQSPAPSPRSTLRQSLPYALTSSDASRTGLQDSHRRVSASSEISGPSSPSPLVARRGLNAGLEARKQARMKLSSQLRHSTSIRDDVRSTPNVESELAVEREASESQASWSDVQDLPVDEGEIEVHDGSEMYISGRGAVDDGKSSRSSTIDADEQHASGQDSVEAVESQRIPDDAGPGQTSESQSMPDNAEFVEMSESQSALDDEESVESAESQSVLDDAESVDGSEDQSMPDDAESQSMPDDVESQSMPDDVESQSMPDDVESYEGSTTYSEEMIDDVDIDPDTTPLASMQSFAQQSTIDDREDNVSARRSVLSERSSNVPQIDLGLSKRKPSQQTIDGAVVERVPSSYHRGQHGSTEGIRRGTRYRYKPLEYWRGERARYGRPSLPKTKPVDSVGDDTIDADAFEDNVVAAPPPVVVLKEIIRIPRAEGEGTFSGLKIPTKRANGEKVSSTTTKRAQLDPTKPTRNPEDGWDKDTQTHAVVFDAAANEEVERQIACTSEQLRPRMAAGCTFGFEKVFVVEDFMATGVLFLLVDGQKPIKNSKDNYYTFVVLEGCVRVCVHTTKFVVAPQGMFFVPRGNDYSIANISKRVARLAFTQAKRPQGD